MNSEKIRTYDELNVDEQEVLDSFRKMKLMWDQARFELFSYQLTDLLENILEKIDQHELAGCM